MVYQQDGNSLLTQAKQPSLDWQPTLTLILFARPTESAYVVEHKQLRPTEFPFYEGLSRPRSKVGHWLALHVGRDDPQIVLRWQLGFSFRYACFNRPDALLQCTGWQFAIDEKNPARLWSPPAQKAATSSDSMRDSKCEVRLAHASLRIEHGGSLSWENRFENLFAGGNVEREKLAY